MAFTIEDINSATDDQMTPELTAALFTKFGQQATAHLTANGHIVKPKADYDAEVENIVKTRNQEAIDKEAALFYASIDTMLTAATGKTKPDKMKTRDWVTELEKEGLVPFTAAQIEKLKKAMAGDPKANGIVEDLQKKIEEFEKKGKSDTDATLAKSINRLIKADLRNASVLIDPLLKTDAEKATAKTNGIADLTDFFNTKYEGREDEDGEPFFVKKGTEVAIMNSAENRAMTPLEILQANHKTLLAPAGHQQKGGGSGKADDNRSATPTTMAEVVRMAGEAGHRFGSPEYKTFIQEKKTEFKIK